MSGWAGAGGATLEGQLARALRHRVELEDLCRELGEIAGQLRAWSSRIPIAVGGWYALSAQAYGHAAGELRARTGWAIQALGDELADVRREIGRLDRQCEQLRHEIAIRSLSAGVG